MPDQTRLVCSLHLHIYHTTQWVQFCRHFDCVCVCLGMSVSVSVYVFVPPVHTQYVSYMDVPVNYHRSALSSHSYTTDSKSNPERTGGMTALCLRFSAATEPCCCHCCCYCYCYCYCYCWEVQIDKDRIEHNPNWILLLEWMNIYCV